MSKTLTLEVSDRVYASLQTVSQSTGQPVEDIARQSLERGISAIEFQMPGEEAPPQRPSWRDYFGCIDSGDPNSCDNDKIDADLAAEYANNHEDVT